MAGATSTLVAGCFAVSPVEPVCRNMNWTVPPGLAPVTVSRPGAEAPGYFQSSLRDLNHFFHFPSAEQNRVVFADCYIDPLNRHRHALHDLAQHLFGLLGLLQGGSVERIYDNAVGEYGD